MAPPGGPAGATGGPATPVARLHIADEHSEPSVTEPSVTEPSVTGPPTGSPATEPTPSQARPDGPPATGDLAAAPLPPWSAERTVPAHEDLPTGELPVTGPATPQDRGPAAPQPPRPASAPLSEPVSRAVQQALAARAVQRARMRRGETDPATPEPVPGEQQELPLSVVPSSDGDEDARDRLLAVLLADPVRAVDATRTLDDSQHRIEELGDVLRRRRDELAGAVRHLDECGLDPTQIGRLSGMAPEDVRTILDGEDAGR
ncbi:hypothetical protein [Pseudonocardia saturnea]|uniref:hypothetical protein n=1 Tax=Pseudonocardia saturnea TaxID=33909 RepID=UPI001141D4BD|nr:hypothetical protein [Pseudonocardia saturnea]